MVRHSSEDKQISSSGTPWRQSERAQHTEVRKVKGITDEKKRANRSHALQRPSKTVESSEASLTRSISSHSVIGKI